MAADLTMQLSDATLRSRTQDALSVMLGRPVTVTDFTRLSSGFSWITYKLTAVLPDGPPRELILRIAPPDGLFAPYSVMPQVLALQAFAASAVPVPELIGYDDDGGALAQPFFVSDCVVGTVAAPWNGSRIDPLQRQSTAEQFIDILADLHRVDHAVSAFAALDDPALGDRIELRPIRRWRAMVARPAQRYYPLLDWAGRWLEDNCPVPTNLTVVHGDYRIGNFLEHDGRITAILDWELTHAGDPHEDLGWALLPTFNGGSRKLYGVIDRDAVVARYSARSGIAVSAKNLAYYEAFALFQAAAIQLCGMLAFEGRSSCDMRMAAMGTQMAAMVRALDIALETVA